LTDKEFYVLIGPVFTREAATTPRRAKFYINRAVYVTAMLILMCTGWMVVAGTQDIRNVGDMARFGSLLFQILAPLQLALVVFFSALLSASTVAVEKDRKTLILLLMTRLSNNELVLGKLFASLLNVIVMLAAALPVFMFIVLLGGVSFEQVGRVYAVTLISALAAGSLGSTLALWREKTFQALSMTVLTLMFWVGIWEGVALLDGSLAGVSYQTLATGFSPLRAIFEATGPLMNSNNELGFLGNGVNLFLVCGLLTTILLNAVAILRIRVWNPSRELRKFAEEQTGQESIWGVKHDLDAGSLTTESEQSQRSGIAENARSGHVDARVRTVEMKSRQVWDNPVLWREICTWAYGRKVLVIRLGYLVLFVMAWAALHFSITSGAALSHGDEVNNVIPASAKCLAPFFFLSLVIINALSVNSITNERDGLSLDLLLVTDISPKEFVIGKLGGIFWITREMVVMPMLLCIYLWYCQGVSTEDLLYLLGGLVVLNVFVALLGIHCGTAYANSRAAIGVSLGTVFFLFVGVITCMAMMISFSSSFQGQLLPFLALILVGGVGLYVSLGARNPSAAIFSASLLLPFASFYAITSFLLGQHLAVFLVSAGVYGFTIMAMLMPAIGEFNIAMGRARTAGEE